MTSDPREAQNNQPAPVAQPAVQPFVWLRNFIYDTQQEVNDEIADIAIVLDNEGASAARPIAANLRLNVIAEIREEIAELVEQFGDELNDNDSQNMMQQVEEHGHFAFIEQEQQHIQQNHPEDFIHILEAFAERLVAQAEDVANAIRARLQLEAQQEVEAQEAIIHHEVEIEAQEPVGMDCECNEDGVLR